jgi:hypothetical protein
MENLRAQELRIGNLVNYKIVDELDERKEWFEPCEIDAIDLQVIDSDYQPIPLTEEWLFKFGFDKNQSPNKDIQVGLVNDDFANNVMSVVWRGFILVKIQHVHQLQNLFYSLTNEELTLAK